MRLPVIDLAAGEAQHAEQVRAAGLDSGFFYCTNHGVPHTVIDAAFAAQRAFFGLPLEQKRTIAADVNNRGYTPMAGAMPVRKIYVRDLLIEHSTVGRLGRLGRPFRLHPAMAAAAPNVPVCPAAALPGGAGMPRVCSAGGVGMPSCMLRTPSTAQLISAAVRLG
jgi:hypothetical protein